MVPPIRIKRVYDKPSAGDGERYLVDRLWPRGVKRAELALTGWLKELAPSPGLRRWFGHQPARWDEFRQRYWDELQGRESAWRPFLASDR